MKKKIVVLGSLNMDLVVRAARHPQPGETLIGTEFQTFPGGKGANQAVAASRLGAEVWMIGRVGQDAFGDVLLKTVQQDGVNTTFIRRDGQAATGVALITLDAAGQNTIVVAPGANMRVTPQDVYESEAAFVGADILLMQLECPLEAVEAATQFAHHHNMKVVLNPAPARPLPAKLLAQADYLLPNQPELRLLAKGEPEVNKAAARLLENGVRNLIVTLGEEGALLITAESQEKIPAFSVEVVDTVAAGDAFAAAFCVALAEGKPLRDAVLWGNAAGAIAVTRQGAQPSMPTRAELIRLLSR
ncbi:MAG: ribokinase [Anaerolineales bacterium]|nr:ribokinase [Anaerolineales bacterium]